MFTKVGRSSFKYFLTFLSLVELASCATDPCNPCDNGVKWGEWTPWSSCSQNNLCVTGFKQRNSTYRDIFACLSCYMRYENVSCGFKNNNCEQFCNSQDGSCTCTNPGYQLNLDNKTCSPKTCAPIVLRPCQETTSDGFGSLCQQAISICDEGLSLGEKCQLSCSNPKQYSLKKFIGLPFGENYDDAKDFVSCIYQSGVMKWDNEDLNDYFCRRSNDPPKNLTLSSNILLEHAPIGTVIGILSATDKLNQSLSYSIQPKVDQFDIDNNMLKSMMVFRLPNANDSIYLVNIRVTDNLGMFLEKIFAIKVKNINDPPTDIKITQITFNNLTPINTVIGVLSAIDPDALNPTYTSEDYNWSLVGDQTYFFLNGSSVILKKKLDDITDSVKVIRVRCGDKDPDEKFLEKDINIYHSNINDYPVNITLTLKTLFENQSVNEVIGKLSAIDLEGQPINFLISNDNQTFGTSGINCSFMGKSLLCETDIILLKPLDYETKSEYLVLIQATDDHGKSKSAQFQVTVENVNEAPFGIRAIDAYISENSSPGAKSACIEVFDPDFKSKVTCGFDVENKIFEIKDMCLYVKNGASIDYEEQKNFTMKILCTDDGQPPLSTSSNITIEVKDLNEAPTRLCLNNTLITPDMHSANSLLSQILIEDPDINESKGICLSKELTNKLFIDMYNCSISYDRSLGYNLFIGIDLTVRNNESFKTVNTNGFIKLDIKCWDKLIPSNVIEASDTFVIQGAPCPEPLVQYGSGCECLKGLTGINCDRNKSLCINDQCSSTTSCSTFIKSKTRCVSGEYVLPVLLNTDFKTFYSGDFRYKIELFVKETLEGNSTSYPISSRKRRNSIVFFVEAASEQPIGSNYMYVKFILMDLDYNLVSSMPLCKMLNNNEQLHCINDADCEIMKRYGFPCTPTVVAGKSVSSIEDKKSSNYSWIIGLIVAIIVLAILVVAFFVYRRRKQNSSDKNLIHMVFNNFSDGSCETRVIFDKKMSQEIHKKKNTANNCQPIEYENSNIEKIKDNFYSSDQKIDHIYETIHRCGGKENVVYSNVNKVFYTYINTVDKSIGNEFVSKNEDYDKLSHKNPTNFS